MDAELFDALPVAALLTRGGAVVAANPAYEAMLGIAAASVVGRSVQELVAERLEGPDAEAASRAAAAHDDGHEHDGTLWCRVIDGHGRRRAVRVRWCAVPRDPSLLMVFLLDDGGATDAKDAAEALALAGGALTMARSEGEVLDRAADALAARGFTVTFLLIDEGDPLLRYGPTRSPKPQSRVAGERSFEATRLPRTLLAQLNPRFHEGRAAFLQQLRGSIEQAYGEEVARDIEAARPGRFVMQAPLFVAGEPYGAIVLTSDDVSPALAGAAEVFAALVARAIEHVRMQVTVVHNERLAAMGEAAAMMAHEVRNPLGALLNAVALLRRGDINSGELLEIIADEAQTLDQIVSDLLALGRPLTTRVARHDVAALVTRAVEVARLRHPSAEIRLHVPGESFASVDPDLVQLAVYNVLRNAVQASPAAAPIEVFVESAIRGCSVRIDDRGAGRRGGSAARALEPNFTIQSGSGIALAAVRRIVEACGGSVDVGATDDDAGRVSLSFLDPA